MMTLTPVILALAAAYDLYVAPAPVQQPVYLAPAQPSMYSAAPSYVAYQPAAPYAVDTSTGSAWVVAAAALAGAAVGLAVSGGRASMLAVSGEAPRSLSRRGVLAAAAAAVPLAAMADGPAELNAGVDGVNLGGYAANNSKNRFNNSNLGAPGGEDLNKGTEDAIAAIARRNAEQQAREKEAKAASFRPKTDEELAADQEKAKTAIIGIAGVGTLASGAFIIPNLTRLATKVASGGKDDGRSAKGKKAAPARGRKAAPAPKETGTLEKLFKVAFARNVDQ